MWIRQDRSWDNLYIFQGGFVGLVQLAEDHSKCIGMKNISKLTGFDQLVVQVNRHFSNSSGPSCLKGSIFGSKKGLTDHCVQLQATILDIIWGNLVSPSSFKVVKKWAS